MKSVDAVMTWLNSLFSLRLPRLPLQGAWSRLTALFQLRTKGPLPEPNAPLPWTIDVNGAYGDLFPDAVVSLQNLRLFVSERELPARVDELAGMNDPRPTGRRSRGSSTPP